MHLAPAQTDGMTETAVLKNTHKTFLNVMNI